MAPCLNENNGDIGRNLGLYWGLHRDNEKEHGNYYAIQGYAGVMTIIWIVTGYTLVL